jgi:hypothetical protein
VKPPLTPCELCDRPYSVLFVRGHRYICKTCKLKWDAVQCPACVGDGRLLGTPCRVCDETGVRPPRVNGPERATA